MGSSFRAEPPVELNAYSIRAVQRVCDLLDILQREPDGVSLARAAEVTDLPKSSAFRYLATLEARRYVERIDGTGDYRVGVALLPVPARQLDAVLRFARPYLEELQAEFGETSNLGMLDANRISYLAIIESPKAMRLAARPGDRDWIHSTALGKAIAAQLPLDRVRAILKAEGMPRHTDRTIARQRDFFAELERIRVVGYALDEGENEVGGRCLGVAVPDVTLPIAISVSGPAARFSSDQVPDVVARLHDAAARLATDLTSSPAK